MRTLKVSDQQIALIKQALGIAEYKFTQIHKEIINDTVLVRNIENKIEQEKQAGIYQEMASKFADLNVAFDNGDLDIYCICNAPKSFLPCNANESSICNLPTHCDYQRKIL